MLECGDAHRGLRPTLPGRRSNGYAWAVKDVVVVGGSLAGASTAIHLARLGLTVQVIDRAEFPRRKACGEGLFPRGVEALEHLGILDRVLEYARPLDSLRLQLGDVSVEAPIGSQRHPAIGIQREFLDAALMEAARRDGVEVTLGVTAVDLIRSGARFTRRAHQSRGFRGQGHRAGRRTAVPHAARRRT